MQEYNRTPLTTFLSTWKENEDYFNMLALVASLSKLFSESSTPYLDYRVAENLFCKYYNAMNDARSCTAYDARLNSLGIGIKTFILKNNSSTEKIAEFNKLKPQLDTLKGIDLARMLGRFRNERMEISNNAYGVNETQYHIVGRIDSNLKVFNVPYDKIDIDNIRLIKNPRGSLSFTDNINEYTFNASKTVLMKRFIVPDDYKDVPVSILEDPLEILSRLLDHKGAGLATTPRYGYDYVLLPLYSTRGKTETVPEKSGLNQWNARGRKRDANEVYFPIPRAIHTNCPGFFPERDEVFDLELPDGTVLSAKVCQDGGKALMSNPNSALGEWILRKVLHKDPGELVTMLDLDIAGFNCVMIERVTGKEGIHGKRVYKARFSEMFRSYSAS